MAVLRRWIFLLICGICINASAWCAQASSGASTARVTIDASKVEGHISPMLYGQFDEFMFEAVKGGVAAELLRDRDFEAAPNAIGLPRYWDRDPDDRNDDPALHFHWDDSVYYPSAQEFINEQTEHSLRADLTHDDGQRRGIRQGDIPIRQGITYKGYLWLKTTGFSGHITVALEADWTSGQTYAAAEINNVAGDWKRYEFTLTPTHADPLAKFVVLFYGRGRLWLDKLSLLPGDAFDGVRADVFQKVKELHPAFIRWPGGNVAQDYHWKWGIGPRDQRYTWTNLSWGNEPEPSDFGTDEFFHFCRRVGAEPSITLNVEGRGATAEEAAAWVEYTNGPLSSHFGALRAANGSAEPFHVKYWEIGNEIWGTWVRAHSDADTYARNYNRYAAAILAVDPSVRLAAVGDNDMNWNRTVLQIAGPHIDYLVIHHYYGDAEMQGDPLNLMARPLAYERFYQQVSKLIHEIVPGRDIRLDINEWNTSLPLPRQHSMESALYAARLMNVFERTDLVAMSAVSDMVNGWSGGVIQASRHDVFLTPTYLVNALYGTHLGTQRLAARVESPTFDTSREGKGIPYLDAVVTRTQDGKQIFIKIVNTDAQRPIRTDVRVNGVNLDPHALLETINADSMTAANSFATPNAVSLQKKTLEAGTSFAVELPKHSVSVITLAVGP